MPELLASGGASNELGTRNSMLSPGDMPGGTSSSISRPDPGNTILMRPPGPTPSGTLVASCVLSLTAAAAAWVADAASGLGGGSGATVGCW